MRMSKVERIIRRSALLEASDRTNSGKPPILDIDAYAKAGVRGNDIAR